MQIIHQERAKGDEDRQTAGDSDSRQYTGRYFSPTNDFRQEFFVFFAIASAYSFFHHTTHCIYSTRPNLCYHACTDMPTYGSPFHSFTYDLLLISDTYTSIHPSIPPLHHIKTDSWTRFLSF